MVSYFGYQKRVLGYAACNKQELFRAIRQNWLLTREK